nr:hypothetical protein [Angustibacter aerolatus]
MPDVVDAEVVGVPDDLLGEQVMLWVAQAPGHPEPDARRGAGPLPRPHRPVQGAGVPRGRRRAAGERQRQGAALGAARAGRRAGGRSRPTDARRRVTVLARRPSAARHAVPGWGRRLVLGDVVRPYTAFVLVGMVAGGAQVVGGLLAPQSLDRGTVVAGLATALLNVVVVRDRLLARAIYWLLARVPPTWPFWARALACWLFSSGGLHAGWSVAATAWAVALPFAVGTSSTGEPGDGRRAARRPACCSSSPRCPRCVAGDTTCSTWCTSARRPCSPSCCGPRSRPCRRPARRCGSRRWWSRRSCSIRCSRCDGCRSRSRRRRGTSR